MPHDKEVHRGECAISDATGDSAVSGLRRGYGSIGLAARQRLQKTQDGEGSLLDQMMILYGHGMGHGNVHSHDPISDLLAGDALGQIRGGRHIQPAKGTPMANLLVRLLDMAGVAADSIGDTGQARGLAAPAASRRRGK